MMDGVLLMVTSNLIRTSFLTRHRWYAYLNIKDKEYLKFRYFTGGYASPTGISSDALGDAIL